MKKKKRFRSLLLIGVFLVITISCEKEDDKNEQKNIPVLSTKEVTDITPITATSGGSITDDRGTTVTARGVCWSIHENPTIDDNKTEDGTGAGNFTSSITGLEINTTYYLRAYATNSAGTGYGSAMSFKTQRGLTDSRDGKVYRTVIIGNQEWMAENLAYAPSNDNYWAYDNDEANVETYGYLYDWQTALNVCPTGWHLPSHMEWEELTLYLGNNAGGKLKATGTIQAGTGLWNEPNAGATNETGFTALPGGRRFKGGYFSGINVYGEWWSATEYDTRFIWMRSMKNDSTNVNSIGYEKEVGLCVRCLRD